MSMRSGEEARRRPSAILDKENDFLGGRMPRFEKMAGLDTARVKREYPSLLW